MRKTVKAASSPRCPVDVVMGHRERKKLEAWRTIRSTALRLISERGYDAVSVEDIAKEAGVSRTTFFSYFPSKEAVAFEFDPQELQQWRALVDAEASDQPLWEALTDLFLDITELLPEWLPVQKRLLVEHPGLIQSARGTCDSFAPDLRAWIARRLPDGDDLRTTLLLNVSMAAFITAVEAWDPDDSVDTLRDTVRTCLRWAGAGLAQPVG
ncbi:TetR family transcriptional regulator [Modestobacter versicolor]|uniref:TetR family transcriptional regulator n=1 Tax=Modestobacter versicolor TaxID=429133 RepID=UPI0034DF1541